MISIPPFRVIGADPPDARAQPARSPVRADGPVRSGHRRDVLVRHARRGPRDRGPDRVNHRVAQILAPHREVDPWAGLRSAETPAGRHAAGGRPPTRDEEPTGRGRRLRSVPSAGLAIDGQVQAVAPLGPAAVVDRDVIVAEQGEDERQLGGRHARAVVAVTIRRPRRHVRFACSRSRSTSPSAKCWRPGRVHRPDRHVDRPRDVAEPLGVALEAAVLGRRPGIKQRHVGRARSPRTSGRRQSQAGRASRREGRRRVTVPRARSTTVAHRPALGSQAGSHRRGSGRTPGRRPAGSTRPAPHRADRCRRRPRRSCHRRHRPLARRPPRAPGRQDGASSAVSPSSTRSVTPVEMDGARDVARAMDLGRRCHRVASERRGCAAPGRPSCSPSHSVVASSSGSGEAGHRRYHTARGPPPTRPMRETGRRPGGLPALSAPGST